MHLIILLLLSASSIAQEIEEDGDKEQVIVFIQKSKESVFTISELLKLETYAQTMKVPVKIIDIERSGAPDDVKYTPFIIYQNYLGRKIYKGRYTTFRRLKSFINTVQFMPSDAGEYTVSNALVWKKGRSEFFAQSKITPLTGDIPVDFDPAFFMAEAWEGVKKGMKEFEFFTHKNFLLSNEIFYLNYYPYASSDGKLYVGYELYSHYDCVTPIYKADIPVKTSIYGTRKAFYLASQSLKTEMMKLWQSSELGDAVSYIDDEIKTVTWEQMGFKIPPPPSKEEKKKINADALVFAKEWKYSGPYSEEKAALQFYFPPPIHQYSGIVPDISGKISFEHPDSFLIASMKGDFEVNTASLTMGVTDLDSAVHHKMLYIKKYPVSYFRIINVRGAKGATISIGKPTQSQIEAEFTLLGKTFTIKAPTQLEPYLNDEGKLFLHVQSSFKIENLSENYNIEGPPGPPQASNNVIIKIDILLEPSIYNN